MEPGKPQGALGATQRWSARRKRDVVLRLLRGEAFDAVSREVGVEIYRLEVWRDQALTGMEGALKQGDSDPLGEELKTAKLHIGELTMEVKILRKEKGSYHPPTPAPVRFSGGGDLDAFPGRFDASQGIRPNLRAG